MGWSRAPSRRSRLEGALADFSLSVRRRFFLRAPKYQFAYFPFHSIPKFLGVRKDIMFVSCSERHDFGRIGGTFVFDQRYCVFARVSGSRTPRKAQRTRTKVFENL